MAQYSLYPKLIIPPELKNPPTPAELAAARVLSVYFRTEVEFLVPSNGYKVKTPDVVIGGVAWEIKCPVGGSKRPTIVNQFKGMRQSKSLVIDGRGLKLDDTVALAWIASEIKYRTSLVRMLYITKQGTVVDCKRKRGYTKK